MGPGNVTGLSLKADDKGAYRACRGGARFGISYWASDAPLTSGICLAQVFLGHESLPNNVALESSPAVPAPPGGPSLPLHGGMVSGEPWSWWARTPPESVYYCVHSPWGPCCLLGARGQDTCLSSGVSSVNSMASYPGKHLGAGMWCRQGLKPSTHILGCSLWSPSSDYQGSNPTRTVPQSVST